MIKIYDINSWFYWKSYKSYKELVNDLLDKNRIEYYNESWKFNKKLYENIKKNKNNNKNIEKILLSLWLWIEN